LFPVFTLLKTLLNEAIFSATYNTRPARQVADEIARVTSLFATCLAKKNCVASCGKRRLGFDFSPGVVCNIFCNLSRDALVSAKLKVAGKIEPQRLKQATFIILIASFFPSVLNGCKSNVKLLLDPQKTV